MSKTLEIATRVGSLFSVEHLLRLAQDAVGFMQIMEKAQGEQLFDAKGT